MLELWQVSLEYNGYNCLNKKTGEKQHGAIHNMAITECCFIMIEKHDLAADSKWLTRCTGQIIWQE